MNEPQEQLSRLLNGYWHTQSIFVAAKLDIANLLKNGPRSVDELAQATGAHTHALRRLLRALASIGIFVADEQHRFGLTPMAECLQNPAIKAMAVMRGSFQYRAWGEFLHSVRTGESAFEKVFGVPIFQYFSENPAEGDLFDQAMTGVHGPETDAMLESYDFTGVKTLIDIGGGNGSVLTAILKRYPAMSGILYDLPQVAERALANIQAANLESRCQVVAGDFFETVPAGAEAYFLRHIIHDWDDDESRTILRNCRRAMERGARLLVVEGIVPPGNDPHFSKFFDLAMMAIPGGMERTEEEFRRLFEAAGFRLARIVSTRSWISTIEGAVT